jgi:hypothetical protein
VMLGAILLHYIAEHDQLSGNGSSEIGVWEDIWRKYLLEQVNIKIMCSWRHSLSELLLELVPIGHILCPMDMNIQQVSCQF